MCKSDWNGIFDQKIGKKWVKRQNNKLKPVFDYFIKNLDEIEAKNYSYLIKAINEIRVISVEIDSPQEAFNIFERTNARGRGLEVADLLKNHIFMHLSDDSSIEDRWTNITANAGSGIPRMLKYFYVSQKGYVSKSELYKKLKDFSTGDAEKLLSEIEKFSDFYKLMRDCDRPEDITNYLNESFGKDQNHNEDRVNYIYNAIDGLRLFGVTQVFPLIYSFLNAFYRTKLDINDRHKKTIFLLFDSIEKYHFINNFICDRIGNDVERLYAHYSEKFSNVKSKFVFESELKNLYIDLKKKIVQESEFIERFKDLSYLGNVKNLMYIFDRFNNLDSNGKKLSSASWSKIFDRNKKYTVNSCNIEHWAPQNPKNDGVDSDVINNIGNLLVIPTSTNGKLGNKTPSEKYNFLIKNAELDRYPFNRKFLEDYGPFDTWTDEQILKRSEDMAEYAYKVVWKFSPPVLEPKQ